MISFLKGKNKNAALDVHGGVVGKNQAYRPSFFSK